MNCAPAWTEERAQIPPTDLELVDSRYLGSILRRYFSLMNNDLVALHQKE